MRPAGVVIPHYAPTCNAAWSIGSAAQHVNLSCSPAVDTKTPVRRCRPHLCHERMDGRDGRVSAGGAPRRPGRRHIVVTAGALQWGFLDRPATRVPTLDDHGRHDIEVPTNPARGPGPGGRTGSTSAYNSREPRFRLGKPRVWQGLTLRGAC